MRLFHFSDDGGIARFVPRAVAVPSVRPAGMDWLNGPLVWAIDEWHQPLYLFPRDAPRVLAWPVATTGAADRAAHFPDPAVRMIAWIEAGWVERLERAVVHRYALPAAGFDALDDAGMWVSRGAVVPERMETIGDLPGALAAAGVALRIVPSLGPVLALRGTSLHVSGIRLRNMADRRGG